MPNDKQQLRNIKVDIKDYKIYLILLRNYALHLESIENFLIQFNLSDESEIVPFILDSKNGYELSRYGHRSEKIHAYNGLRNMYTYNGNGSYQSCKTSHSYK